MLAACAPRLTGGADRQLAAVLRAHAGAALADVRALGVFLASGSGDCRRQALRRLVRDGRSASAAAWLALVAFEWRRDARARAKRALLAALRRCVWAKPLYMAALGGPLAGEFDGSERQALLRAMVRAGIRTHIIFATE
ncbi:hypothetical protein H4R23_000971 [Coemansia sp. Cherry 401B]|nr:hypothetical protein H4R23_000971 [Coemansia sp. Cherry 401B]